MKSVYISIIGKPNVGKSTLLNCLIKEKVSIVSAKPQTTRNRITGILTEDDTQFVFIDTPGIHKPKNELGKFMVTAADEAIGAVDLIFFVIEAYPHVSEIENSIIERISKCNIPTFLLVNKTDIHNAEEIGDTILSFSKLHAFEEVYPVSAFKKSGTKEVLDAAKKYAQEGPWYFPEDMITDQPEKQIASEIIREKLLRFLDKEIPHGTAVVIEEFKEDTMLRIRAEIYCEKESHKRIIIGKNGDTLKNIGSRAREDLERFFGCKVYLNLWVKVKENWRDSSALVKNFGYKEI